MKFTDEQIKHRVRLLKDKYPNATESQLTASFYRWNSYQDWLIIKAEHDNWLKIQSYEADLAQYQTNLEAYNNWVWSVDTPTKPELPTPVSKPKGYYNQEEVDASVVKHTEWVQSEPVDDGTVFFQSVHDSWVAKEPQILLGPIDTPEPVVPVLLDPVPNTPEPEFTAEELAQQEYQRKIVDRTKAVKDIVVTTTNGIKFDGDEISQGRMARAVLALPDDTTTIQWKTADNTFASVTKGELLEALSLAGAAQATLWIQYA